MKNTVKNLIFKKSVVALSLLLVLCQILTVVSFAAETEYATISLNKDAGKLTCDGKVYNYYHFYEEDRLYIDPTNVFHYASEVEHSGDFSGRATFFAYAPEKDSEIMWIESTNQKYIYMYATAKGAITLDRFVNGSYSFIRLWHDDGTFGTVEKGELLRLQNSYKNQSKINIKISSLKNLKSYRLSVYDSTDTVSIDIGGIFVTSKGEYLFIDYTVLGNNYFDISGMFDLSNIGSVAALTLSGELLDTVKKSLANPSDIEVNDSYEFNIEEPVTTDGETDTNDVFFDDEFFEDDRIMTPEERTITISFFWITVFFAGIVAPIAVIIIGCSLAKKKKNDDPRYWYAFAISGGVWLFLSLVFTAVVLVI